MDLERFYKTQAEIPAGLEGLYSEKDGQFALADLGLTDNSEDATNLRQQRNVNSGLNKELADSKAALGRLQKQFEGVDPEQFAQFQTRLAQIGEEEERKLIATGQIDEVVKRRTANVMSDMTTKLTNQTEAYDTLKGDHAKLQGIHAGMQAGIKIESIISEKGLRVADGAKGDLADRIGKDWTVDGDGKLTPRRDDMLGENGAPIEPVDYVARELLAKRNFFFEKAKGGGSDGNTDAGNRPTGKTLNSNDIHGIGRNLEAVANGKIEVVRE